MRKAVYRKLIHEVIGDDEIAQIRSATPLGWPLGNDCFKSELEAMQRQRVAYNTRGGARFGAGRKHFLRDLPP